MMKPDRNAQSAPAPAVSSGYFADRHKAIPWPDGSVQCTGCTGPRYSPAAYAAHIAGKSPQDIIGDVYVLNGDSFSPPPSESEAERHERTQEAAAAEAREFAVRRYWDEQSRRRGVTIAAGGTSRWLTD